MLPKEYLDLIGEVGEEPGEAELPGWVEFRQPVSVDFLANVFRMSRDSVRKNLGDCPEVRPHRYDFVEASRYLVKPQLPIDEVLRAFRQNDLPPKLQAAFWDAMRKRQAWEREAGHLWHSEDVVGLFGQVFQSLKSAVQLFEESVEREAEVTDRQREVLIRLSDGLLRELHAKLVEVTQAQRTGAQIEDEGDAA